MTQQVFGRSWSVWMADSVLEKFPELRNRWAYDYGVLCKGMEKVYEATGDERYFRYIRENMDYFLAEEGKIRYYDPEACNLDYVNNGKTLLYLYRKTGKERYREAAKILREQLKTHPRTAEGGFWHKKIYPYQMWLDGLYMAQPFYAEYIHLFEAESGYEDILLQFDLIDRHLKDPKTHLLYHGWDEKRESIWADKETGRSANFWGRSLGWYACALVDTLDYVEGEENRARLITKVKDLAEALVRIQSPENGVFYQVLDRPKEIGNYPESSCSCMFTYFLLKAIRMGYIEDSYFAAAKKAFYGIVQVFVEIDEKGLVNLKNTVYAGGLGGDQLRDGSYEYYVSEPKQVNSLLGIGPFIQASAEMDRYRIGK